MHESFETLPTVEDQKKKSFDQYLLHVCAQADCSSVHAMKSCKSMNWQAISRGKKKRVHGTPVYLWME
jgi:hypothetical protein